MEPYIFFVIFLILLFAVIFSIYYFYTPKVHIQPEIWPWTSYSFWPYWAGGGGGGGGDGSIRQSSYTKPWGGTGRVANGIHNGGQGGHGR